MSELVKRGSKRGEVSATVRVANDTYIATYGRPKKRSITRNGVELDITQAEFEKILGLSYTQFLTAMYTVQGGGDRFINKNDSDKKEFLLQLMNLDKFTDCRKQAQAECKSLETEISNLKVKVEKAKSKIEVYTEQLVDKEQINKQIDDVHGQCVNLGLHIKRLSEVEKPDLTKIYEIQKKIEEKKSVFASLRIQKKLLHDEHYRIQQMISDFVPSLPDAECPSCAAPLSVKNNTVAAHSDQAALKDQHDKHMKQLALSLAETTSKIDEMDEKLYKEKEVLNLEEKIRDDREKKLRQYNKAQNDISITEAKLEPLRKETNRLHDLLDVADQVENKIKTLKELMKQCNHQIADKSNELEVYRDVVSMYSPTGAPAYVMDSILESFNEAVNNYTSLIWPSATYSLKSYKEKKPGEFTTKFSESLIINGQTTSIGALSGGEQRAFSLAVDFAIADILSKQFAMPLNPIIMDEPFEGLDAIGRETVIELLEKLAVNRQIWVVDHASEAKSMFSKILRVEKKNGTSYIVA